MKELSIEEKAKAYDEVVNKLEGFMAQGVDPLITRADVQDFFPELKESGDGRIRKHLLKLCDRWVIGGVAENYETASIKVDNIIAWLEKQDEHANFLNKIQIGDKVTRNKDGMLVNLSQLDRVAKKDEKQDEQKPAWSEEDNIICQEVIHAIDNCERFEQERNHENCVDFRHYQVLREWLKFLSKRYLLQPKQEWSKEDKDMFGIISDLLWEGYKMSGGKPTWEEIRDWFRSNYPHKQWKPSDAQIASLTIACDRNDRIGFDLTQLLRDLKKLKG